MKSSKGSAFEREICKKLSLWWSNNQSDDIFWRTAGSGARATTRRKSGKDTFGQAGDVQATDPVGQPLIDLCNIEIKRGYSKAHLAELLDAPDHLKPCLYAQFIEQAVNDAEAAGSPYWWLIVKRDRRVPIIIIPRQFISKLKLRSPLTKVEGCYFAVKYTAKTNRIYTVRKIVGCPLDNFLEHVSSVYVRNKYHRLIQKSKK